MIGSASVDLSVLMAGLPSISGWFNLIDQAGCINGQIKLQIQSKDELPIHQKRLDAAPNWKKISNDDEAACESHKVDQSNDSTPKEQTAEDSALSRALKRKFTELEEITQRLRARLFDVTGNMTMDPEDEFENDLNTIPDEEDDFEESNIASEMSLDWLEHCQNHANEWNGNDDPVNFASQMRDIFEILSPTSNQTTPMQFKTMNERTGGADSENSVQNIADTLKKSLLND